MVRKSKANHQVKDDWAVTSIGHQRTLLSAA